MKKIISFIMICFLLGAPSSLRAQDTELLEPPEYVPPTYLDKITGKFQYGFMNFIGGWTELYNEPADAKAEGTSVVAGAGKGLSHAFVYTLGGAVNLVSFFIPRQIPLPEGGVIMYPPGEERQPPSRLERINQYPLAFH